MGINRSYNVDVTCIQFETSNWWLVRRKATWAPISQDKGAERRVLGGFLELEPCWIATFAVLMLEMYL